MRKLWGLFTGICGRNINYLVISVPTFYMYRIPRKPSKLNRKQKEKGILSASIAFWMKRLILYSSPHWLHFASTANRQINLSYTKVTCRRQKIFLNIYLFLLNPHARYLEFPKIVSKLRVRIKTKNKSILFTALFWSFLIYLE